MTTNTSFMHEDRSPSQSRDFASFLYLLKFARPMRAKFIVGFVLLIASAAIAMLSARALGLLVDRGIQAQDMALSIKYAVAVIALEILTLVLAFVARKRIAAASLEAILQIREELFARLETLPMSYFDRTPQGRTVTRLTHDVESLEDFFSSTLGKLLYSLIMAGVALLAMLFTQAWLGLLALLSIIPATIIAVGTRGLTRTYNRQISQRNSAINSTLAEYLNGISVLRAFGLEQWSVVQFDKRVMAHLEANLYLNRIFCWLRPLIGSLSTLPLIVIVWVGGHEVLAGAMQVGVLVSFVRYFERFGRPMMELSFEIHAVQQAFTSAERIAAFLQAPGEEIELGQDGTQMLGSMQGKISFKNVTMRYGKEGAVALNGVSFEALAGQKIGLTGATGSGKSTTVALLARLYEFEQGEIQIDGTPIRSFNRDSLRSHLGFVSQEVMIIKGSVRDNLTLGSELSDEQIWATAKETGLARVLARRGLKLDSLLLEQGLNLSVGERQLISFTRILLKNPRVLILDEATANIDHAHEKLIQEAIGVVMRDRTCLIIAHRLSTLAQCDKILVFRGGQIVEEGTHEQLLHAGGTYAGLWARGVEASVGVEQPG